MPSLRSSFAFILSLAAGIALSFHLPQVPLLVDLEHQAFWFPERNEPEKFFADHGNLPDFQVTPLDFSAAGDPIKSATLEIDAETKEILGSDSLDPAHWAYLLNQARKKGGETIAIAAPLSWVEAGEIPIRALDYEISNFPHAVLGITCEKTGDSPPLPTRLHDSVIPSGTWILNQLPEIDHLTQPPSAQASLYGVSSIKGFKPSITKNEMDLPLLVRWGKNILPSLELASLMAHEGLAPSDVRIEESGHLRLGADGPIIRIDSQGRTKITAYANTPQSAARILTDPADETADFQTLFLISPEAPPNHRQLTQTVDDLSRHRPQCRAPYQRWEPRFEISFLVLLALVLLFGRFWMLVPLAAAFILSPLYAHQWLVLSPALAVALTFFVLRPSAPPATKEEPEIFLDSEPENPPTKKSPSPSPEPKPKPAPKPQTKLSPEIIVKKGPPKKEIVGKESPKPNSKKAPGKRKK